ncbi:MAG: hypothetical protein QG640_12 [Patescibacteria group bacterium]|nr:hypothetical protein [Patescibacteria group bacterium]
MIRTIAPKELRMAIVTNTKTVGRGFFTAECHLTGRLIRCSLETGGIIKEHGGVHKFETKKRDYPEFNGIIWYMPKDDDENVANLWSHNMEMPVGTTTHSTQETGISNPVIPSTAEIGDEIPAELIPELKQRSGESNKSYKFRLKRMGYVLVPANQSV